MARGRTRSTEPIVTVGNGKCNLSRMKTPEDGYALLFEGNFLNRTRSSIIRSLPKVFVYSLLGVRLRSTVSFYRGLHSDSDHGSRL